MGVIPPRSRIPNWRRPVPRRWNGRAELDPTAVSLLGDARDRMMGDLTASIRDWAEARGLGTAIVIPEIGDEPYCG